MSNPPIIFAGTSNPALANAICNHRGLPPLGKAQIGRFSDGEVQVEIQENVRNQHVYVIQSTCAPVNDNLQELLVIGDALKRASAASVTAVIPYFGYSRQDRKVAPRAPITAKLVADQLSVAGFRRVLTVDIHAGQIQGFFDVPCDNLYATPLFLEEIRRTVLFPEEVVIVSPDAGGAVRARAYAKALGCEIALIDKRRAKANVSQVMNVVGEVKGKAALIVDDMVDTAGTLVHAAEALMERGATSVTAYATHGVLSGPAVERIVQSAALTRLVVTDTIPLTPGRADLLGDKVCVLSSAPLLGEAIHRIHNGDSLSSLFE